MGPVRVRYVLVVTWITLTTGLAAWWLVFGLHQSERLLALENETATELARHQRMLVSEGAMLILLVLAGGIAILYFMNRERKHHEQVRQFFATYTHDLKTSLASLRLQAETLQEDLAGSEHARIITRLVKDTVRLELQLENSLYLANQEAELYFESLNLRRVLSSFEHHWPEVQIIVQGDADLRADARALESILKNVIQNAISHGGAGQVYLEITDAGVGKVRVRIRDNGKGFDGQAERLGKLFVRHNSRSGSGVGLYLARHLIKKMKGELRIHPRSDEGFVVEFALKGSMR